MAPRRTLSARWLLRHQHGEARRKRRRLLQQAGRPYMKKVIISVHVPKTAGMSFAVWLESIFGCGRIVRDNADRPIDPKSEMNVDPARFLSRYGAARELPEEARAVHRHF